MIAPFWADINTRNGGNIYYRETTDSELQDKAAIEVRLAYPNLSSFSAGWLFIATWDQVAFFGTCNSNLRNTFQLILATDNTYSFAILYYNNITWTTGTASGGNCSEGLGGRPAKAGFDVGDGITFYEIPGSCTDSIVDVDEGSNINFPGKFIFRVDDSFRPPSCSNSSSEKLVISPSFVPLLGHVSITLRGACLEPDEELTCRFTDPAKGTFSVTGTNANSSITCEVPFLYSYGKILVELLVASGEVYSGYIYTVEPIPELDLNVTLVENQEWDLSLVWDPVQYGGEEMLLEIVYYENGQEELWEEPNVLLTDIPNSGSYKTHFESRRLTSSTSTLLFSLRSSASLRILAPVVRFGPLIVASALLLIDYDAACNDWYENDSGPPTGIEPCPPLLAQAEVDERFERDSAGPLLGFFHPGAEASFVKELQVLLEQVNNVFTKMEGFYWAHLEVEPQTCTARIRLWDFSNIKFTTLEPGSFAVSLVHWMNHVGNITRSDHRIQAETISRPALETETEILISQHST
jgi:hypothetical protein